MSEEQQREQRDHRERHDHLDVSVSQKNVFGLRDIAQLLIGLAALVGVYVTLTNNDTKMQSEINQHKMDLVRLEAAQKDIKSEIKNDLATITYELRELRSELLKRSQRQQ